MIFEEPRSIPRLRKTRSLPRGLRHHYGSPDLNTPLAAEISRLFPVDPNNRHDDRFERLLKRWYGGDWFDRYLRYAGLGWDWLDRSES